jgi:AcrR family transcriptional regulator
VHAIAVPVGIALIQNDRTQSSAALTLVQARTTLLTSQSVKMSRTTLNDLSAEAAAPKRSRRKEARPGELLEAALDLFVEKGFAATRVDEVAARAGVSKGTLFLYFPSKEELFKAVVRENIAGRFAEWNTELESFVGTTSDVLRYCYQVWWERIGATKASGITKLMFSEAQNFPEIAQFYQQEVILPGRALVRRILQRGVERGEFQAMDLDYGTYIVLAPMMFLMLWNNSMGPCSLPDESFSPEEYLRAQVDNMLHGLCVRPGPAAMPSSAACCPPPSTSS